MVMLKGGRFGGPQSCPTLASPAFAGGAASRKRHREVAGKPGPDCCASDTACGSCTSGGARVESLPFELTAEMSTAASLLGAVPAAAHPAFHPTYAPVQPTRAPVQPAPLWVDPDAP